MINNLQITCANGANSCNAGLAAINSFMYYLEYRAPSALEQVQHMGAIPRCGPWKVRSTNRTRE